MRLAHEAITEDTYYTCVSDLIRHIRQEDLDEVRNLMGEKYTRLHIVRSIRQHLQQGDAAYAVWLEHAHGRNLICVYGDSPQTSPTEPGGVWLLGTEVLDAVPVSLLMSEARKYLETLVPGVYANCIPVESRRSIALVHRLGAEIVNTGDYITFFYTSPGVPRV